MHVPDRDAPADPAPAGPAQQLADLTAQLAGVTRRATQLQAITVALAGALRVEDVTSVVVQHCHALFAASATLVFLREGEVLRLVAAAGAPPERAAIYSEVPLSGSLPICEAVRDEKPLWFTDREALCRRYPALAGSERDGRALQAMVLLPLHDGTAAVGGLGFSFYAPQQIGALEREFFLMAAAQCAQAIARACLFEALQRQQQATATLLDASAALSATLDSRAALEELARLVVPGLADWCAIDELAADGQVRRLAVQHTDPRKVALAHAAVRLQPIDPDDPGGIGQVLRTGKPEWTARMPPELLAGIPDPELRAIFHELGLRSYAIVPMIARGRVLGALSLVHAESGRVFTEVDLRFAQELASRAALALDNARLYESAESARAQLHDLFKHAPAAICLSRGPEHIYELANAPYVQFLGRGELLGRSLREALPGPDGAALLAIQDRVYTTGEAFVSGELAVADGRHFNVVYQPTRDAAGQVTGLATFGFEVSEHVRARQQLRAAEAAARGHAEALEIINERLELALAVTGLGCWDVDVRAGQFACDERCRVLLGLSDRPTHRIGSGLAAIHADDREAVRAVLERAMDPTSSGRYDCEFRTRRTVDGAPRWVRGAGQVYFVADRATRLVGTMLDITARKRDEDDLRRRGEFEQQLIGIVSHDLRNPISAMIMSAALLAQRLPADSPLATTNGRILSSGDRAVRLIRDLLDFTQARSVSGIPIQRSVADVHLVCQQTAEEVMLGHPTRSVVHRPVGDGVGLWDPDRLAQVVSNLAVNAVSYSPVDTPVYIDSHGDETCVVIEVHNQGAPIPADVLPGLFEPFKRRERRQDPDRSIGLGLFIVREIVAAHGGTVQARSSAEHGTCFRIELPRGEAGKPRGTAS